MNNTDKLGLNNKEMLAGLSNKLKSYSGPPIKLMEVCGTHTMAISKYGIRSILPENIKLFSGPGCPVCVTPSYYIKSALQLSSRNDVIITTFGDMMRVPYDGMDLLKKRALGADVRIVYSPFDSILIAKENPDKKVVFLSVGFETTIPIIASALLESIEEGIDNFYLLTANKMIDKPLKLLSSDKDIGIDGYIYPGHVSSIIGDSLYKEIAREFGIPGVITGFDPADILGAINILVENIKSSNFELTNLYTRVVKPDGNKKARDIMYKVFEECDATWRGIGEIKGTGLKLSTKYADKCAWSFIDPQSFNDITENEACKCGEILKGKCLPTDCKLFGKVCLPDSPVGSCMVSSEGTCAAYYKYC
jgi:hydrogenase expression/formation protein HypD